MWQTDILLTEGHHIAVRFQPASDDRPIIVFFHGITGSADFWPGLIPARITDRYQCIAISLPGHFPSQLPKGMTVGDVTPALFARIFESVSDRFFSGRRVHLCGWSTGGFWALLAAAIHPDRVLTVTSVSGFVNGRWHGLLGHLQWLAASRLPRSVFRSVFRLLQNYPSITGKILFRFAGPRSRRSAGQLIEQIQKSGFFRTLAALDPESLRIVMGGLRSVSVSGILERVRCRVTVVHGTSDPIIMPDQAGEILRLIPQAVPVWIDGGGHLFSAEFPEVMAALTETVESL